MQQGAPHQQLGCDGDPVEADPAPERWLQQCAWLAAERPVEEPEPKRQRPEPAYWRRRRRYEPAEGEASC